MAILYLTARNHNTLAWSVARLSSSWNSSNFQRIVLSTDSSGSGKNGSTTAPYGIVHTMYPPASGSNDYTPSWEFSGLTPSSSYHLYAYSLAQSGKWYFADDEYVTMPQAPQPPSSLTGLSASATSKSSVSLSWNSTSRADYYDVYRGNYWIESVWGTSTNVYNLSEYTNYDFTVIPMNSVGSGYSQTRSVRTLDQTNPTISITNTDEANTITLYWTAHDSHSGLNQFQVYISQENGTSSYYKSTVSATNTWKYEFTSDGLGNPLEIGSTYRVGVRAYDKSGNYSGIVYVDRKVITNRPNNWVWYTTKSSGYAFNLTASEWQTFIDRIDGFRQYKGMYNYGFTNPTKGQPFYNYQFNQARIAINDMSPSTSIPSAVKKDDTITAYGLNRLRDSLNSID